MKFTTLTRYRITTYVLLFLALMSMAAMMKDMEVLSLTCITGIMTVLSTYIWGQTKRPSRKIVEEYSRELKNEAEHENKQ